MLSNHWLYEHFCRKKVESLVSVDLILQMNDSWRVKLKSKLKNVLV